MNRRVLFRRQVGRLAVIAAICAVCAAFALPIAARSPQVNDATFRAAVEAFRNGHFKDAARQFEQVVAGSPAHAGAHAGLVRSLLKQERLADAAAAAERAAAAAPADAAVLAARGDVCYRQGDLTGSHRMYAAALAADATSARAHLGLARLDLAARRNRTAKVELEKAFALDASDPEVVGLWAATLPTRAQRLEALDRYLAIAGSEDPRRIAAVKAQQASLRAVGDKRLRVIVDPSRSYRLDLHPRATQNGLAPLHDLQVTINGQKLRLELDTGASGIMLKRKAAQRSRVVELASGGPLVGVGNERAPSVSRALAERISIGELEIRNVPVDVLSRDVQVLQNADGLIGADVFEHFLVRLNFPARTVELSALGTGQKSVAEDFWAAERQLRADFTPVHVFGHLLVADTEINDRAGFLMILDSGANVHVVSTPVLAKISGLSAATVKVTGLSGAARETLFAERQVTLTFAGVRQPGRFLAVDFSEQSKGPGVEMSGVIGSEALALLDMTIDYTNGLVRLVYNP